MGKFILNNLSVLLVAVVAIWYAAAPPASAAGPGYLLFPAAYQFQDNNGAICTGCLLDSFLAGTSTPSATYNDQALTIANTNPIVLNASGRNPNGGIYGADGAVIAYKFVLRTASGSTIWTQDNVSIPATAAPMAPAAVPTGAILSFAGSAAPSGFLLCDGAFVSRTIFSGLFAAIGTTYGAGDGVTTFRLPDLRGRFPFGKAVSGTGATLGDQFGAIDHTHASAAHTHNIPAHTHSVPGLSVPFAGWTTILNAPPTAGVLQAGGSGVGSETQVTQASANNITGTGVTGGTAVVSESTTPGNTSLANPPGLSVNFIVKQ